MSAGGHHHGDPTLPVQPASRLGLLSAGIVLLLVWTSPLQSVLWYDVIKRCKLAPDAKAPKSHSESEIKNISFQKNMGFFLFQQLEVILPLSY